jgi:hypothetical protein
MKYYFGGFIIIKKIGVNTIDAQLKPSFNILKKTKVIEK